MEGESRTIVSKLVVGGDQIMGHSMSEWPGVASARPGHSVSYPTHSSHRLLSSINKQRSWGSRCQDQRCVCENIHLVILKVVCACVRVYVSCAAHAYMCKAAASRVDRLSPALSKLVTSLGGLECGGVSQRMERLLISMQKIKDRDEVPSKACVHISYMVVCSCVPWWLIKSC